MHLVLTKDWKTGQKPIGFHENQRNWSERVSPVFDKPANESDFFKIFDFFWKNGLSVSVPVYR
jgi:hypothetical protein